TARIRRPRWARRTSNTSVSDRGARHTAGRMVVFAPKFVTVTGRDALMEPPESGVCDSGILRLHVAVRKDIGGRRLAIAARAEQNTDSPGRLQMPARSRKRKQDDEYPDRSTIVPRIKHRQFLKSLRDMDVPDDQMPVTEPLVADLLVTYAFDLPGMFQMVT